MTRQYSRLATAEALDPVSVSISGVSATLYGFTDNGQYYCMVSMLNGMLEGHWNVVGDITIVTRRQELTPFDAMSYANALTSLSNFASENTTASDVLASLVRH